MVMNNKYPKASCLLAGTLFLSTCIAAADLGEGLINESDSILLNNQNAQYSRWNGVGQMFWNDEPSCTARQLDKPHKHKKALGPAYLMTAAHFLSEGQEPDPTI